MKSRKASSGRVAHLPDSVVVSVGPKPAGKLTPASVAKIRDAVARSDRPVPTTPMVSPPSPPKQPEPPASQQES